MQNIIPSIFSLILLGLTHISGAATANTQAPDFSLPGMSSTVRLADYRGKTVYLDFWASWCGPCRQSFPWMNELQEKYATQDLVVIAVNLDQDRGDADTFLHGMPHNFIVAFDKEGKVPRQYGVKGMPTSVLIDKEGKVVFQHIGFHKDKASAVEQKIQSVL